MENLYIRFGGIPSDGISHAWNDDGTIAGPEPGVSVYDASVTPGSVRLILPSPLTRSAIDTLISLLLYQRRRVFLVTGTPCGTGHDNEPCLTGVRIIRDVTEEFTIR